MEERAGARSNISTSVEVRKHNRERARKLLYEAHGLSKDPYLELDASGRLVCKLCKTKHSSEMNYVRHREGKKHKRRVPEESSKAVPEYEVRNLAREDKKGFAIIAKFPLAKERPTFRFVSSLEQSVEEFNDEFQYVVFMCAPYENIGFRFSSGGVSDKFAEFDPENRVFTLHFFCERYR
jgi:splicing factor 3A subunit 2